MLFGRKASCDAPYAPTSKLDLTSACRSATRDLSRRKNRVLGRPPKMTASIEAVTRYFAKTEMHI
jgi:hypothetical protein